MPDEEDRSRRAHNAWRALDGKTAKLDAVLCCAPTVNLCWNSYEITHDATCPATVAPGSEAGIAARRAVVWAMVLYLADVGIRWVERLETQPGQYEWIPFNPDAART